MTQKEYAGWLADKIPAYGDYAKEAAQVLRRQADEIDRLHEALQLATAGLSFEAKRLRRVAMLMGVAVPESDEALMVAAGGVLGEIERAIERVFMVPNNAGVTGAEPQAERPR